MLSAQQCDIGYFEGDTESFIYFSLLNVKTCSLSASLYNYCIMYSTYCQVVHSAYFRNQSLNKMTCSLKVFLPLSCHWGWELRKAVFPCRSLKLGEMISVHLTEEQIGRNSRRLSRAVVICRPSSVLNLSLWLSQGQCQVIFPFRGQANVTEGTGPSSSVWKVEYSELGGMILN